MIFGAVHGGYVLADPEVTGAGNLLLRVGAKRRTRDLDRPDGWEQVATVVLTPDETLDLWRMIRAARLAVMWDELEEQLADR